MIAPPRASCCQNNPPEIGVEGHEAVADQSEREQRITRGDQQPGLDIRGSSKSALMSSIARDASDPNRSNVVRPLSAMSTRVAS
jgi:hypothetical protein